MAQRVALIFGVSGQDGAYLSHLLLAKGYRVHGVSRDVARTDLSRLARLGLIERMTLHSADLAAPRGGFDLIDALKPNEIYNLSGQSSAGQSFATPQETFDSIAAASVNLLEALRAQKRPARLFQAASSDCFGDSADALDEDSPLRPRSPYAVATAPASWPTMNRRCARPSLSPARSSAPLSRSRAGPRNG
jgi:GDPmannose 4,6-dehydratase